MLFIETRGNDSSFPKQVKFSDALLSPIASYGGIYCPEILPTLDPEFLGSQLGASYKTLALSLLNLFEVDIDPQVLRQGLDLYDRFDDADNPVPLVRVADNIYVSELFHGPTRAFKDMALQPFGEVLSSLAKQRQQQYLILAATSGDTGPAALETFRNRDNIRVVCLYPDGGTSDVQRLQMVTESAQNLKVIGIEGDFDDAQAALKSLLASPSFKQRLDELDISLSAANSVNFGRIIFQIIYHIHSYLELVRQNVISLGDKVFLNIPSGNFGNALGAYYAQKMGLPVAKIIISSNANNVLTELINTGKYDISNKSLIQTTSPAMDILKSSNVERVLFDLFGAQRTRELMQQLDEHRCYQLESHELEQLQQIFVANFCSDEQGSQFIRKHFEKGYLMDPHTATCFKAYENDALNALPSIVYSTAEWTKFSPVIDQAITGNSPGSDKQALESIAATANIGIPQVIQALFDKPICHDKVIDKQLIEAEIMAFLRD
ncbi:MAG: threonine synthase [Gammaproteobacteria bacterium]|jgi:threonine synthase